MKRSILASFAAASFLLVACSSVQTRQKSGTAFETDSDGHTKAVTYVSPEEYERMAPEERAHAQVSQGVEASVRLGKSRPPSEPVAEEDLAKAMKSAN